MPADSPAAGAQASAGKVGVAEWAVIVDNDAATELADGQIGEIWISGQNMGTGYWNKPDETIATFQNILKSRTNPSHAEGAADDATWVRTGDFGAFYEGDIYITGRVKDLLIVDGRNHYPQDIEHTVAEATPAVRAGFVVAFSIPRGTSEGLVIVAERAPGHGRADPETVTADIRAAVSRGHGLAVADIRLVSAGAVPRTTSGKLARQAARAEYLAGAFGKRESQG